MVIRERLGWRSEVVVSSCFFIMILFWNARFATFGMVLFSEFYIPLFCFVSPIYAISVIPPAVISFRYASRGLYQ